jgi:signal transduction histidine kinase
MSGVMTTRRARGPWRAVGCWAGDGVIAAARGLAFVGLMLAGIGPLLALVLAAALTLVVLRGMSVAHPQGPVPARIAALFLLMSCTVPAMRWLTGCTRRLAGRWCGVPIASPYLPQPSDADLEPSLSGQFLRLLRWLVTDPASWRDLLWLAVDTCGGWLLAAAPAGLVLYGLAGITAPGLGLQVPRISSHLGGLAAWEAVLLGVAVAAAGLWAGPRLLRAYARLAGSMLAPTRPTGLAVRVAHLARTRAESIDTGAAEIRRIERDLHDGAQARLVAMGMTLDAAGQLLDTDPGAARALLVEARDSSARALAGLRDLVRGVHPPVLADRGLADAVQALTLDSPLRAHCAGQLPGRAPAPVESAAYFAVSELLANVSKHAHADRVWIDIRHESGMLRIGVADDGGGGADPGAGTGLRGIERHLAAFDGVLAVTSPPGGPTVVNMEVPCALSSPKTSSC